MELIAYYEGSDEVEEWLKSLLERDITFKKLPTNSSTEYTQLPSHISDILYLDKPDIILSGRIDDVYEKPIFSIEFASCTPQYQHALQRFSRMMASVTSGCPSAIIMPKQKAENEGGIRLYKRSRALEYGTVKLMDSYRIPAFVFDWPDTDGNLENEPGTSLPTLSAPGIVSLKNLLFKALSAFQNLDYIASLWKLKEVTLLVENTRSRAYGGGAPTIDRPGGGEGAATQSKLDLLNTKSFIDDVIDKHEVLKSYFKNMPEYITRRESSLVFYPTRMVEHAGDPYVGMIGYYDIAFCRNGPSTRDRIYNLIAYCETLSIDEVETAMAKFNAQTCPFREPVKPSNVLKFSYHLKHGCRETKIKPLRIYSELADIVIFKNGVLFNVG